MAVQGGTPAVGTGGVLLIWSVLIAVIGIISVWTPLAHPAIADRWFSLPNLLWFAPVPVLVVAATAMLQRSLKSDSSHAMPFVLTLALVFLGYPLHPPGRPDKLRDTHLPEIKAPMLFVQGSRDTFGTPGELEPIIKMMKARVTLHRVVGGDHSFKVSGRKPAEVYGEVMDGICDFVV